MPVEIRELVIRAVVQNEHEAPKSDTGARHLDEHNIAAIVEECVKQVLKILQKNGDR
ncbi:MAG: hypothetical protein KF778_03945 [Rhodocyclaceae bacterium]|nr:hypothetical protein [Rhodocyclaceae bacterium]MBX3667532.1 hypothetical protein [Rhodocyclaceae bacterium]